MKQAIRGYNLQLTDTGRPDREWLDDIADWFGMDLQQLVELKPTLHVLGGSRLTVFMCWTPCP